MNHTPQIIAKVAPEVATECLQRNGSKQSTASSNLALVRHRSWTEAMDQAHDAKDSLPAHMLRGKNALSRFCYTNAIAPSSASWWIHYFIAVGFSGAAVVCMRELGFGPPGQLAIAFMGIHLICKGFCRPCGADKEEWPVYVMLRALDDQQREAFLRDTDVPRVILGMASMDLRIVFLMLNIWCGLWAGVVCDSRSTLAKWLFCASMCLLQAIHFFGAPMTTIYMVGVFRSLANLIRSLDLWEVNPDGTVDFVSAYEGVHGMLQHVEAASEAFQSFFFMAEFVLVLVMIAQTFAIWDEFQSGDATPLVLACTISFFVTIVAVVLMICRRASEVTAAVQELPDRVQKLCAQIAVSDEKQVGKVQLFLAHVKEVTCSAGFKCMGLIISPTAILKLVYTALGAAATLISLAMTLNRQNLMTVPLGVKP
jgi:hypothetical protein